RGWFIKILTSLFSGNVGRHSLRSGGATALAEAGIPFYMIQGIGRWKGDTFQTYIRQHPSIVAAAIRQKQTTKNPTH
ncbi:hypothetical protein FA15DRAFT_604783, partial [Coprinopsis marcescibilis]